MELENTVVLTPNQKLARAKRLLAIASLEAEIAQQLHISPEETRQPVAEVTGMD